MSCTRRKESGESHKRIPFAEDVPVTWSELGEWTERGVLSEHLIIASRKQKSEHGPTGGDVNESKVIITTQETAMKEKEGEAWAAKNTTDKEHAFSENKRPAQFQAAGSFPPWFWSVCEERGAVPHSLSPPPPPLPLSHGEGNVPDKVMGDSVCGRGVAGSPVPFTPPPPLHRVGPVPGKVVGYTVCGRDSGSVSRTAAVQERRVRLAGAAFVRQAL